MATEGTDKSEPPPAYQETAAIKDDGGQTDTNTTNKQQNEKAPNEPIPDGEGIFGSPLKRVIWVGIIYLLYVILALWFPIYYMDYYVNYCDKYCEAAYGYDATSAAYIPTCVQLCDQVDNDGVDERAAGYSLITLGMVFSAIGVILAYFGVKSNNRLYCQISAGLLLIGGIMQIIGIIVLISEPEDPEELVLAGLIIAWLEVTIPATIAIILAVDVYNATFLNDSKTRSLALSSILFAVAGLMAAILYAYSANYEFTGSSGLYVISVEHPWKDELGCIAAGYFIISIFAVVRILINFDIIKIENEDNMVSLKLVIAVLLIIGSIICAAGYWAMVDTKYQCDDPSGVCIAPDYEGQDKCAVVGYTFFIIGLCIINALDMDMVENLKACQAKNASGGGGNATNAPPTQQ